MNFQLCTLPATSKTILFLLLCIGTVCSIFFIDRYQNIGPQLLLNPDFSEGLNHWHTLEKSSGEIITENNQLTIRSDDAAEAVQIYQKIPPGLSGEKLRLQAILASNDVAGGEENWHRARLLLVQYIAEKPQWQLPHSLASLEGTHDWESYSETFRLSSHCTEIRVIAEINHTSGEFSAKDLSLYEVEETTLYPWVKWLVRGAWILFVFVLFGSGLRGKGSKPVKMSIILTVIGIVIGTTLPGQVKNELKGDIVREAETYTAPVKKSAKDFADGAQYEFAAPDITKIAHFCLFGLLAFLLVLHNPLRPRRMILLELLMLACATELMQFYVDGRSPLFGDVAIDMAGGVIGMIVGKGVASLKWEN